jgi:hypothetical protein
MALLIVSSYYVKILSGKSGTCRRDNKCDAPDRCVAHMVYNFGNLLSTSASVGRRPLSPSFITAGAGPGFPGALW